MSNIRGQGPFASAFAWWGDDLALGLRGEALVAGVGEDLQVNGVGEQVDQAGVTSLGDVGDGSGPDLAAEQWSSALISDDEGFHGVDSALADRLRPPRCAPGRRTLISVASISAVWPVAPR
ncbi:hypothetical protein [Streptomyces sp. NPDC086010]|uniref:hypothetical protein n=1 Tax=Streptomyces sp. NPDC086010 TaxID=3365745 RepID=UPI0037D4FC1C